MTFSSLLLTNKARNLSRMIPNVLSRNKYHLRVSSYRHSPCCNTDSYKDKRCHGQQLSICQQSSRIGDANVVWWRHPSSHGASSTSCSSSVLVSVLVSVSVSFSFPFPTESLGVSGVTCTAKGCGWLWTGFSAFSTGSVAMTSTSMLVPGENWWAISSNVRPFVSGTLKKTNTVKTTIIMKNRRNVYSSRASWTRQRKNRMLRHN